MKYKITALAIPGHGGVRIGSTIIETGQSAIIDNPDWQNMHPAGSGHVLVEPVQEVEAEEPTPKARRQK